MAKNNKIALYDYFKNKISNILLVFIVFTFFVFIFVIIHSQYLLEKNKINYLKFVITNSVDILKIKLEKLDLVFHDNLSSFLYNLQLNYEINNSIEVLKNTIKSHETLDKFKNYVENISPLIKIDKINYYFISKEGVIFDTDYITDLGFDFEKSKIWNKISVLKKGEIFISPLSREKKTGIIRIYGYLKLSEGNILEIGFSFKGIDKIIENEILKYSNRDFKVEKVFVLSYLNYKNNSTNNEDYSNYEFTTKEVKYLYDSFKSKKVIIKKTALNKLIFYYRTDTRYGKKNIKIIVISGYLLNIILFTLILFVFFIMEILIIYRKIKIISFDFANYIKNLADLFTNFKFSNKEIEKLKKIKKSGIIELDLIFNNFYKMVEEITKYNNILISDKELLQKLYNESKQNFILFKRLAEIIPSSLLIIKNNEYFYANEYTTKLFEVPYNQIKDKKLLDFILNEDRDFVRDILIKGLKKQKFKDEKIIKIISANNKEKWVKLSALSIDIEDENGILFLFTDINELKLKEIQLNRINNAIIRIANITNSILSSLEISFESFIKTLFRLIFDIIDEADYGSVRVVKGDKVVFIDAIGHDFELLKDIHFSIDELYNVNSDKITIIENIVESNFQNHKKNQKKYNLIVKASKPIKSTLYFNFSTKRRILASISLDIDKNSNKNFSDISILIVKFLKDFVSIYFELKENADNLKMILYSIGNGVIVTGRNGKIILANKRIYELLNIPEINLKNQNYKILFKNFVVKKIFQKSKNSIDSNSMNFNYKEISLENFYASKEGVYEFYLIPKFYQKEKVEKEHIFEVEKKQYFDDLKIFLGYIIIINDITKEVELNKQLIQAQKLETIGAFTGGISHDFNNMLGSILGSSELIKMILLKKKLNKSDIAEIEDYIDIIIGKALQGKSFIRKLLDFSRVSEQVFEIVDLHNLLNEILIIVNKTIKKTTKLKLNLKAKSHFIKCDPVSIENVFLNLIQNADHAIEHNKGLILIETYDYDIESGEIVEHFYNDAQRDFIKILVSDNGKGIKKEYLDKIFDPFFTTKDKSKGTGLGLSMVYNTIKNLNGFIKVDSQPNIGTTFILYLPVIEADKSQGLKEKKEYSLKDLLNIEKKVNILVIDDEKEILYVFKNFFEKMGFNIYTANNGNQGLKLYKELYETKKINVDLIILDLLMPVIDGKDTFYKLKEINPEVKVIVSSGYTDTVNLQKLLDDGVADILFKPFKLEEIVKKIENVLNI